MIKILKWIGGVTVVLFMLLQVWPAKDDGKTNGNDIEKIVAAVTYIPVAAMVLNDTAAIFATSQTEVMHDFTTPQQNAIRSAKQYLNLHGFSRLGLIQQLSSGEGYAVSQAGYGARQADV
jgi:hypothetical protein